MKRIAAILALALAGCNVPCRPIVRPTPLFRHIALCGDISRYDALWVREFERSGKVRCGDPLYVSTHGGDDGQQWVVGSGLFPPEPMDDFLRRLKRQPGNKGKLIVLLSCNPGGYTLRVPGVWYPRKTLASKPGWGSKSWALGPEDFVYSGDE